MLQFTIKGLNNMGNTCYLNASFQMLIQNKDFCMLVQTLNEPDMLLLNKFINDYYGLENQAPLTPRVVKDIVAKANPVFEKFNQEDSAEFLGYFLNSNNTFNRLFEIETLVTVKCKLRKCLHTSSHFEKHIMLDLPIDNSCENLDDCYRNFKVHEKLEGDDMYDCPMCKCKRIGSKKLEVSKWPNHLLIHLLRFTSEQRKINVDIDVPFVWRHGYTLKGAVIHSGNYGGGHYFYISKNNNVYTKCDDANITQISEDSAISYFNKAYILYYEKR